MRSDNQLSLLNLIERVSKNLLGVQCVLVTSSDGDLAPKTFAEVRVREINAQTGLLRCSDSSTRRIR